MQLWQLALQAAQSGGYGGYGGYGGEAPAAPTPPPAAPAPVVPGFSLPYGGSPAIKTGGGYYTDKNGNMTAKWQRLAGV